MKLTNLAQTEFLLHLHSCFFLEPTKQQSKSNLGIRYVHETIVSGPTMSGSINGVFIPTNGVLPVKNRKEWGK